MKVAKQLTDRDALAAHARDELGLTDITAAQPLRAAFASALSFAVGAVVPTAAAVLSAPAYRLQMISVATLLGLVLLGAISAKAGGARMLPAIFRVTLWGIIAMSATAWIGSIVGAAL